MNASTFLILIVVGGVVFYFWGTGIVTYVQTLENQYQIQVATGINNNALKVIPQAGQKICSLKVVFNPYITENIVPPIYAVINNGASSISWYNCVSSTPALDWLYPRNMITPDSLSLIPLDLFGISKPSASGYSFTGILVSSTGGQITPIVNPVPAIGLNNNISGVGQTFSITLVYQNVPYQYYTLQLSSNTIGINQAGTGNIYSQQINP